MIQKILQFVESKFIMGFRVGMAAFVFSLMLFALVINSKAQISSITLHGMEHVQNEHRFSVLETEMEGMKKNLEELKQHSYLQLLAMLGILGETGVRILKGRKGV